ncbi:hypothetical protein JAAARDRAFT_42514 [Jaapia argillacea MUCL 33604]|uniref:Uncharacterized protein n=1 Tax=Jaapia argillacea MUCL 33604 TaxID=933084 RepID=A0A067P579_9AGAM|nr:hypothetical protein JAAARDRAFT_42514 [Jaapia argillacea MUCL 33604]
MSQTTYFFSIEDTSPSLEYQPWVDGDYTTGWQMWYTGSAFSQGSPGAEGTGVSYHSTSLFGANVTFHFYGTGFTLYGQSNCSFNVGVDGEVVATQLSSLNNVLYTDGDLSQGQHTVTLTATPNSTSSQILSFDGVVLSNSIPQSSGALVPRIFDNTDYDALQYFGNWTVQTDPRVPSVAHPASFHQTNISGASVFLNFTGRAVLVNGTVDSTSGRYSVELDGQMTLSNGSTSWFVPDALLFYMDGLDPNSTHLLNITNVDDGLTLQLNTFTVYSNVLTSGGASSGSGHSISGGLIAGVVVAVVAVIIILVLALSRRRRI